MGNVSRQSQRELSQAVAQILLGLPVYLYHWSIIKKDNKEGKKD